MDELEHIAQALVGRLVDDGFVASEDEIDALGAVRSEIEIMGCAPKYWAAQKSQRTPLMSTRERRKIVDSYLKFLSEGPWRNDVKQRKLQVLGVSAQMMSQWAAGCYGHRALSRCSAEARERRRRVRSGEAA